MLKPMPSVMRVGLRTGVPLLFWVTSIVSCTTPSCAREHRGPQPASPPLSATAELPTDAPATMRPDDGTASLAQNGIKPNLSLDAAQLYYTGEWLTAYQAYREGDYQTARTLILSLQKKPATAKNALARQHADILLGLCEAGLSQWQAAATAFAAATSESPALADWLSYQQARALYFAGDTKRALALANAVAPDAIVGADAALLAADIIRGQGDATATATAYRDYLDKRPNGIRRPEARFRLAEALVAQKNPAATKEATTLLRALWINEPIAKWGEQAARLLKEIAPAAAGAPLSSAEHMARGMALFEAMRNPQSAAAFQAALATTELSAKDRCVAGYHLGQSWFKERKRELAVPAFMAAVAACKAVDNKDLWLRSAYQAGRSYVILGQAKEAAAMFAQAKTVDPSNTITDDAWLREAEAWTLLADEAKITATLSAIPKNFPAGDMRAEALWRLGFRAWQQGRIADAISWWQQQIVSMPIDQNAWGEGQAQYWLGRAYASQGKRNDAVAQWKRAVATYPLSYYALLSLNRLRELDTALFDETLAPLRFDVATPATTPQFAPRADWNTPGFLRAIEFLRLGLGTEAEAELRKLGLVPPGNRKQIEDPDQLDKLWAIAFIYDRAERYSTSHWPSRWHTLDYKRSWPNAQWRAYWQVAYPLAFGDLLREHAAKNNVPFAMQIAIVREESAFTPTLESFANAIGLTQMIIPTAQRFAKGTGITVSREALQDPTNNVTIGSRFLGYLFTYWNRFEPLMPASYNAGEGAVKRALKLRGKMPTDEFIESIVTDETRLYSKRVLATYFVYAWLYEQRVPTIPNAIPAELLSK